MAKSRRNRAARRKDPIAKPVKAPSDPELAALRTSKVLPVLADLQSAEPKSRSAAAAAVSNIITDARCRKLLLREQIVHIVLTQTLTDDDMESRAAGWRILQVLAQEEEADFCVHLYRQDVLTAIEFAAKKVTETLQTYEHKKPAKASDLPMNLKIALSLVYLITALAEAQDEILEAISRNSSIIGMIFYLVSREHPVLEDRPSERIDTEALNCLLGLVEDNAQLAKAVTKSDCFKRLLQLKDQVTDPGIIACGVLHNMSSALADSNKDTSEFEDALLIPTLAATLSQAQEGKAQAAGQDTFVDPMTSQHQAAEILASIGTNLTAAAGKEERLPKASRGPKQTNGNAKTEDDPDESMDVDDAEGDAGSDEEDPEADEEEDDEMDEDAMAADMDMVTGVDDDDDTGIHDLDQLPALKALITTGAIESLVRISTLSPSDESALHLQTLSLSALGNIAWSVSLIDFSDPLNQPIQAAWAPVARMIWQGTVTPILASDTADLALATNVTSLAWAVARTLHGSDAPLKAGEHRRFISLYQATKGTSSDGPALEPVDPFQGLGVKCIGVLGQLALHPAPTNLNREIGTFLVTAVASLPNTPAADAVEALNQIFDIYGDEEYPYDKEVFWQGGFLKHLEDAAPKAKAMLKTVDKRQQPELRARADEAVLNLSRFLGYKKKHQP